MDIKTLKKVTFGQTMLIESSDDQHEDGASGLGHRSSSDSLDTGIDCTRLDQDRAGSGSPRNFSCEQSNDSLPLDNDGDGARWHYRNMTLAALRARHRFVALDDSITASETDSDFLDDPLRPPMLCSGHDLTAQFAEALSISETGNWDGQRRRDESVYLKGVPQRAQNATDRIINGRDPDSNAIG